MKLKSVEYRQKKAIKIKINLIKMKTNESLNTSMISDLMLKNLKRILSIKKVEKTLKTKRKTIRIVYIDEFSRNMLFM